MNQFVDKIKPNILIDLGCNTGDFSIESLKSGANYVIGYDFDQNVIDEAFKLSKLKKLNFLHIVSHYEQGKREYMEDRIIIRCN